MSELRVLGLFDHRGVRRHQNRRPADEQTSGPYCVQLLMNEGIDLIPVRPARGRIHKKLRDVIEHRTGVQIDLAVRGMFDAFRADAVLGLLEGMAVFPALLKQRGLPPYSRLPITAVSCWWAEEIITGTDAQRAAIARALTGIDRLIVFSRNQVDVFGRLGAAEKVVPVLFGVDTDWYRPDPSVTRRYQVRNSGCSVPESTATITGSILNWITRRCLVMVQ